MGSYYYRLTPAAWAAAQVRGYLLESSTEAYGGVAWTYLYNSLKPNHGPMFFRVEVSEGVFVLVEATVSLGVSYTPGANDIWPDGKPRAVGGMITALSQIPLSDVTVL